MISLELIDPRLFHLDLALAVLDDERDHIAYYPDAFSQRSRRLLSELFPMPSLRPSVTRTPSDSTRSATGCMSVPAGARQLREGLADAGYWPISIDLSELIKGGGSEMLPSRSGLCRNLVILAHVAPLLSSSLARRRKALSVLARPDTSGAIDARRRSIFPDNSCGHTPGASS